MAFQGFLKQSTATTMKLGPFVDKTDGVTYEAGMAAAMNHADTGVRISKNGGAFAARTTATEPVYDAFGYYLVNLDATDTATVGRLKVIFGAAATCLPCEADFCVLEEATFDALITNAAGAAGGLMIAGSNAATTFATLDVTGACTHGSTVLGNVTAGTVTQTGAASWGATTLASMAVTGALSVGTTTTFTGNVTAAAGITVTQSTLNGAGVSITGNGSGTGLRVYGGATGMGAYFSGTSYGVAMYSSGSGDGLRIAGAGSGAGIYVEAGATGHGLLILGGATSGDGIYAAGQTAGDGMTLIGAGAGQYDLNADIQGNLVGTVSTVTTLTNHTPQTGDTYALAAGATGFAAIDTVVDTILEDTAVIGALGAGLTAIPWNAAWDAEVQSECTDALNAYDPPTNAEMEARTLVAANYATAANQTTILGYVDCLPASWVTVSTTAEIKTAMEAAGGHLSLILEDTGTTLPGTLTTIAGYLDTEIAAILADTNELQTDWVDGGRLDLIVDAILEDTGTTLDGRIPAALVTGRMSSDAVAISGSTTAADKLELSALSIETGAAAAGTLSTTQMTTTLTEATNDHYIGRIVIWTSGVLLRQATDITDYDGDTGTLTFTAVTEAPTAGDTFIIV